jgi:D-sedoheptulose 7-phosphate isomerase
MTETRIAGILHEAVEILAKMAAAQSDTIAAIAAMAVRALKNGRRIYVAGCGGSAADAQHMAGEIVGRFQKERRGLPCVALTTDTSVLTAVANDYGFERTFARQVEALAEPGDFVLLLSTSGNSPSILEAARAAKAKGAATAGMTGAGGGALRAAVDCCLCVEAAEACRVQECHGAAIHAICEVVEDAMVAED